MTEYRTRQLLLSLTAAAALFAAAFLIFQPGLPAPRAEQQPSDARLGPAKPLREKSDDPDAGPMVVSSDIFSATRLAPRERYNPSAGDAPQQPTTGFVAPESLEPPPRLSGVMNGPGGAAALMQMDSSGSSGRLYHAGDRIGGYRLVKIDDSSVIVSGPRGRVRIRVSSTDTPRR